LLPKNCGNLNFRFSFFAWKKKSFRKKCRFKYTFAGGGLLLFFVITHYTHYWTNSEHILQTVQFLKAKRISNTKFKFSYCRNFKQKVWKSFRHKILGQKYENAHWNALHLFSLQAQETASPFLGLLWVCLVEGVSSSRSKWKTRKLFFRWWTFGKGAFWLWLFFLFLWSRLGEKQHFLRLCVVFLLKGLIESNHCFLF